VVSSPRKVCKCASCTGFQCGSGATSSRPPLISMHQALSGYALSYTWLTTAASSPTLTQDDCARLTLVRFSSVGRAPTSAIHSFFVQLDIESGTICRRISDSRTVSYSRFRQSPKTLLFVQWDRSAVCVSPFNCALEIPLITQLLNILHLLRSKLNTQIFGYGHRTLF